MLGQRSCYPTATLIDPYGNFSICVGSGEEAAFDYQIFTHIDLTQFGGSKVPMSNVGPDGIINAFADLGIPVKVDGCEIIIQTQLDFCPDPCNTLIEIPVYGYVAVNLETSCSVNIPYGNFDFIDLTDYGGSATTVVNSNEDIIDVLNTLGYDTYIDDCDIIIASHTPLPDIPVGTNSSFTLIDTDEGLIPCDGVNFDYTQFDGVDMSQFGGATSTPVSSDVELKFTIEFLTDLTVEINGCTIDVIDNPSGLTFVDCEVCQYPTIQLVDSTAQITPCNGSSYDFTQFQFVDFSPYGGGVEAVNDINDVKQRLQQLTGAVVSINGCDITIQSCTKVANNLEVSGGTCFNCSLTTQYVAPNDYINLTFQLTEQLANGSTTSIADGTIVNIKVRDELSAIVSEANVIVGQDITTPAGVSGASTGWLGTNGFATHLGDSIGGGFTLVGNASMSTKFFKREWARKNSKAGPNLGQDYTIEFSIADKDNCSSNTFTIPKITEGKNYSLVLKDVDEDCAVTYQQGGLSGRVLLGIFKNAYFDLNSLRVVKDNSLTWVTHAAQPTNCGWPGPQVATVSPADSTIYHVGLSDYQLAATELQELRGFRMALKNNTDILYDFNANPLTLSAHAISEYPELNTECSLTEFSTVGSIQPVTINEKFKFFWDDTNTTNGMDTTCPYNMVRPRVFVATSSGVGIDPETGLEIVSGLPADPTDPLNSEYSASVQTVTFAAEGIYRWQAEVTRDEDCTTSQDVINATLCGDCNGGNEDTTLNSVFQEGIYLISSY